MAKAHVRRGDMVVVTKGKEKGKRGRVKRMLRGARVEVEKVNIVKRHTRPTQKNPHGGILEKEGSIAVANVSLWCEQCSAGRRSRTQVGDGGDKSRVCVKCGTAFPAPGA
ncbi:50S ribosomal protein L24 [Haliangium sp.]|uniref:50S ribosomal protein L24 n=1 Tax=Haliangium sp. TaxID=2663208 RepID=UPI003D14BC1A